MRKLYVEFANTPIKREMGLMGRKKMGKNQGMLFEFPSLRRLSFWMSNTYLPLDIAFIDNDGIVTEIREMVPMSTRSVISKTYCKYALEVNKGWFKENNIKEGSLVSGFGIKTKLNTHCIAQMTPQSPQENFPVEPGLQSPLSSQGTPQQEPLSQNPDVLLEKSHKEIIEDAEIKGKDLILIYITKDGIMLPPKVISPPFVFEEDEDGRGDAIVKAWDNQDASWKSFLIDNIISLEEKEEPRPIEVPKEKEEKLIPGKEI